MADFINSFWDLYVSGLVAFGLLFCLVVLVTNMTSKESGEPKLQGHVWDENLREYNNPLPRWWLYLFWATVIFSIFYLYLFPGFGNRHSNPADPEKDRGLRAQYAQEVFDAEGTYGPIFARYQGISVETLAKDPDAVATGQRLFLTYCAQCHGSLGQGSRGFPNLTDGDWLYGGDPETIKGSISEGRAGMMTPLGGTLTADEIKDAANYVRSLSNLSHDAARAARGRDIFTGKGTCLTCHGADGKGAVAMGISMGVPAMGLLGAPNLTDSVWLYDNSEDAIIEGITRGRNAGPGSLTNNMPAWKDFLGEAKVHVLAAYVYSLSNK
ncbi:MAG: cytochrome-c oxidase, cbb3-type subunit III [Azoarcus sp.]|jgi:cytochrome c oxidase cbb3-type subunit 3|nr:cytochrome-c oxidase, cbb3-type subunit III [Azoarcus sp.]